MKKNVFLAGAALLSIFQAHAQKRPNFTNRQHAGSAVIHNMLSRQWSNTAAQKPTGIQQRVIAQGLTDLTGSEVSLDSFLFKYSGTNGSVYDYNQFGYNQSFEPVYAPMQIDHRYDADPMKLLADTIINYYDEELYSMERASYRSDKKLDSIFGYEPDGSDFSLYSKTFMHFTATGHIDTVTAMEGQPMDIYSIHSYKYNTGETKLLTDTVFMPDMPGTYFAYQYKYNATSGRLDTSYATYQTTPNTQRNRVIYDYYSDGKIRKTTSQSFTNGAWTTDGFDSLGYTAGVNYYTYWKQSHTFFDGTQNVEYSYLTRQFPGTGGAPDSSVSYNSDFMTNEWTRESKIVYTYNSFGNPVKLVGTDFDEDGTATPEGFINFYYETYDDNLAIRPVTENTALAVYPNPFTNSINIDWKEQKTGKISLKLTNIAGQDVFKTTLNLTPGKNAISIPATLSHGQYILQVQDAHGQSWSHKMIKK